MALELIVSQNGINKNLDIFSDNSFEINYSIANIKDIANTNGTFTKTITLPDTPTNREVFGFITNLATDIGYNFDDHNVGYSYDPNLKVKCWVLEDTITVLEGYIQITRFNISDTTKDKTIEAVIYADNASFYITMGDKLLTDLDFNEYDFTLSESFIQSTWTNATQSYLKGVYFPLIDYGNGWTLDDLSNLSTYNLTVKDFRPAVYIKTIWDKIFAENGFKYNSNFLSNDKRFLNLIIPWFQQTFQTNTLFNQDKIFHLGLSFSNCGEYAPMGYGPYLTNHLIGKWYTGSTSLPKLITNGENSSLSDRYIWYSGLLINPFLTATNRNTYYNTTDNTFTYGSVYVQAGSPASFTYPMFNTYVNGGYTFNPASLVTDAYYQNRTNTVFKQRFVLKTDIVTTYSNQFNIQNGVPNNTSATGQNYNYVLKVEFFREINPATGVTSSLWATGTGAKIPADLGGVIGVCVDPYGTVDRLTHWVCDITGRSNCFTADGDLIYPTGPDRYLGKYCTDNTGASALGNPGDGAPHFPRQSGDCIAWYYNNGDYQSTTQSVGWWCSGYDEPSVSSGYSSGQEATFHPGYGDWYQGLQLQTIFLDGDTTNPMYGASGYISVNGNMPIQPGERVRCVVTIGGKYRGQQVTSVRSSYKPPTAAYLLSQTYFQNGVYNNDGRVPLTQFYNDVSNDYITNQTVNFNDLIPKNIKQREFIQDIIRLHNLYVEPDRSEDKKSNVLLIEPRDDYYAKGGVALDWRDKLDINEPIEVQILGETQNKRTIFTFKTDSDWYNKQYTLNSNEVYGQFIYNMDNEFLISDLKIESIFAPTPLVQLYSYAAISGGDIVISPGGFTIPVLVSGSNVKPNSNGGPNGSVQTQMRILYKNYISNANSDQIYIFSNLTHNYPYAGPYDNPYTPTYAVNWGQTLGEFFQTPTDQFYSNLVNTYWRSTLSDLGDVDSKIITCKMFLTPQDINNFYFYKQVFVTIDGVDGYYKVNSIDGYTPGINQTCKVELLKTKSHLPVKKYQGSTSLSSGGPVIITVPGGGSTSTGGASIGG